ncbi:MAG: sugar phosphate isomerase/epimerase [Planctomycetes bacterium]|nr:sugar phosphate isomerase/epimerase [Planctomycetota bacterium]
MTMIPLGIQMYTVRKDTAKDYPAALARVAGIGYKGVEVAGLHEHTAAEVGRMAADAGLPVISAHIGPKIDKSIGELVDLAGGLGTDTIVCAVYHMERYTSMDLVRSAAEDLQATAEALKAHGLRLALHNHGFEMERLDGVYALERIFQAAPDLLAEVDTYWATDMGPVDVPALIGRMADRVALLHLKDGNMVRGDRDFLTAVGNGKMDFGPILAAADPDVLRWAVVEIDSFHGDMWQAVEDSYRNITQAGLAG